ncbi:3-dehydroquinate synthase [Catalinimonas niigatensis]|uniref:3-dehydroquinate synthase n=1 Tax=Catalinimonas niigatensis TaxID=1397264 RepID=UPI002665EB61|nr:3-dehydroquinate synthase [Catalinimonas niigatensis]WPP49395.1 3-dehydroquinate synthase [Catalinimonas niigatensis]
MPAQNVTLTQDIALTLKAYFSDYKPGQIGVLVDENTKKHCYPLVKESLPPHSLCEIRSGELNKNLATCSQIWEWMTTEHFDRKALLINLGGGVIGDMGGFCAATYKRGIPFINLPTTLLAQVDASVGGKLGIDFKGYKNHIGLFQEPEQVIVYPHFVQSLPPEEVRSGFAEVIKHSLIRDAAYWPRVKAQGLEVADWTAHIAHSIDIKATVVDADFREGGLRKILNYGHTIGHAIESYFLETDRRLLHGEAIAIGMVAENLLSVKYCAMPQAEADEVSRFLLDIYGYREIATEDEEAIIQLTLQDKKNEGSTVKAALLEGIGKATYDISISAADVSEGLAYYRQYKP